MSFTFHAPHPKDTPHRRRMYRGNQHQKVPLRIFRP